MREAVLNIEIKTNILNEEKHIGIQINVFKELFEEDKTISEYIIEYMEDYLQENYCCCSFNESQNHCDCGCGCGDWGYDFDIVSIESEQGGEI